MVISKDKEKIQSVPFAELTQAVAIRSAHLLNAILYEFMLRHIPVSFVDGRGHIVGQLDSSEYQLQRLSAQRRATAYADIEQAAPQMELFFTDNYAYTRGFCCCRVNASLYTREQVQVCQPSQYWQDYRHKAWNEDGWEVQHD